MSAFCHYDLALLNPAFDSPLVDVLTELEHLRRLRLQGTTPVPLFHQLKGIFHMLESLGSARIEGNHTTLADYVESKLAGTSPANADQLRELTNIEKAMAYIEEAHTAGATLTEHFIRELHTLAVTGLQREGDATPGAYRTGNVRIAQSAHQPPDAVHAPHYLQELVDFINERHSRKYDLIKVALAHHRFAWVHPFSNGNGRVVRLLTYALLIQYGFNVNAAGRVLNPTAVFCNDRDRYYTMLSQADTGTAEGLEAWCHYVLEGILAELQKVNQLTDYRYLSEQILMPAVLAARQHQRITPVEEAMLKIAASKGVVKAADLKLAMPGATSAQRTYQIGKLVERGLLQPISKGARQYTLGISHSDLLRGVIRALEGEGFIPASLRGC